LELEQGQDHSPHLHRVERETRSTAVHKPATKSLAAKAPTEGKTPVGAVKVARAVKPERSPSLKLTASTGNNLGPTFIGKITI
jgi:hypothetical protein